MEYGNIAGIDKPVSRLIQGTAMIGSAEEAKWFDLMDGVYELGCRAYDTAHVYGRGDGERTLGRWIHSRGNRDEIVIITKGAHPMDGRKRVTPEDIDSDIADSLERLGVDHIDLYLLHRDDPEVPVEPIIDVLNKNLDAGRIKAIGGSNWVYQRIKAANDYAKANGLTPFAVSSPQFSLGEMVEEPWAGCISASGQQGKEARQWYLENDIPLVPWSSLAAGLFSGRFTRDNLDQFTEYWDKIVVDAYCSEENFQRVDRATQLAKDKGVTLPQIALAFVVNQPNEIFPLVGCRTPEEMAANIAACELKLTEEEMNWVNLE